MENIVDINCTNIFPSLFPTHNVDLIGKACFQKPVTSSLILQDSEKGVPNLWLLSHSKLCCIALFLLTLYMI